MSTSAEDDYGTLAGGVWRPEGVGEQAQDVGDDGQQRRWIDAVVGCPTCLGRDFSLEEALQEAAQLRPGRITERHLRQEPRGLGGQDLHRAGCCMPLGPQRVFPAVPRLGFLGSQQRLWPDPTERRSRAGETAAMTARQAAPSSSLEAHLILLR